MDGNHQIGLVRRVTVWCSTLTISMLRRPDAHEKCMLKDKKSPLPREGFSNLARKTDLTTQ